MQIVGVVVQLLWVREQKQEAGFRESVSCHLHLAARMTSHPPPASKPAIRTDDRLEKVQFVKLLMHCSVLKLTDFRLLDKVQMQMIGRKQSIV